MKTRNRKEYNKISGLCFDMFKKFFENWQITLIRIDSEYEPKLNNYQYKFTIAGAIGEGILEEIEKGLDMIKPEGRGIFVYFLQPDKTIGVISVFYMGKEGGLYELQSKK